MSVPVVKTFQGQTVWEGVAEVFKLSQVYSITEPHDKVYGWAVENNGKAEYLSVLSNRPINATIAAMRAWIVSQAKQ